MRRIANSSSKKQASWWFLKFSLHWDSCKLAPGIASSLSLKWVKYKGFVMNNDNYFIEASLSSRGLPNEKKQSSFPTGRLPLKLTRQNIHYFLFSSQLIFQVVGSLFFNQNSIFFHVTAILRAVM